MWMVTSWKVQGDFRRVVEKTYLVISMHSNAFLERLYWIFTQGGAFLEGILTQKCVYSCKILIEFYKETSQKIFTWNGLVRTFITDWIHKSCKATSEISFCKMFLEERSSECGVSKKDCFICTTEGWLCVTILWGSAQLKQTRFSLSLAKKIMRKDKSATQSNKEMTEMDIVETSKVFFVLKKLP